MRLILNLMDMVMESIPTIQPISLGACADEILHMEESAWVQGVTSTGIFLNFKSGKVLFLTSAPWHGPITINLSKDFPTGRLKIGMDVHLAYPRMVCPECEILITNSTLVWKPDPIEFHFSTDANEIMNRAQRLSSALKFKGQFFPFYDVLETTSNQKSNLMEKKTRIQAWFHLRRRRRIYDVEEVLGRFLGLGGGLTPAGDDFIIGYLLANFYMGSKKSSNIDAFLAKAYDETTALSANLIDCAAKGSADERIIGALRFLEAGENDCDRVIKELLSYGSSSGIESLVGMLTAIFLQD